MRKFNRMIVAGALAVTLMLAPADMAAAKTVAVVQTADGEQTVKIGRASCRERV